MSTTDPIPRRVALRVAPQRSTQYQELASAFAEPELARSPLGPFLGDIERRTIGDADWLVADLADGAPIGSVAPTLAATSDVFGIDDGCWHPIAVHKRAVVPRSMVETRRYQGKTNELFTRLCVNLALFDRDAAGTPGTPRLLDPLCGGGTTLFAALERNCAAVGADADTAAVQGTARFVEQFAREAGIGCRVDEQRHKGRGRDWHLQLRTDPPLRCSLLSAGADSVVSAMQGAPGGAKVHAVVGDLPYGIQHPGHVADLVAQLAAVVDDVLTGDGVAVLAWNASRVGRDVLETAVRDAASGRLAIEDTSDLAHRVDRVIKRREVLVLRRQVP